MNHFKPKRPPVNVDPLIAELWKEANRQRANFQDVADRAGINQNMISAWRRRKKPLLCNIQAVGNVLGMELHWKRK